MQNDLLRKAFYPIYFKKKDYKQFYKFKSNTYVSFDLIKIFTLIYRILIFLDKSILIVEMILSRRKSCIYYI